MSRVAIGDFKKSNANFGKRTISLIIIMYPFISRAVLARIAISGNYSYYSLTIKKRAGVEGESFRDCLGGNEYHRTQGLCTRGETVDLGDYKHWMRWCCGLRGTQVTEKWWRLLKGDQ